jgi:hypothetical protein
LQKFENAFSSETTARANASALFAFNTEFWADRLIGFIESRLTSSPKTGEGLCRIPAGDRRAYPK